jgi:threonine dehydratase
MTNLRQPTLAGVRAAAAKLAAIRPQSPLIVHYINGLTVASKMESLQPVVAFKLRGSWHRLTALSAQIRAGGSSPSRRGIMLKCRRWAGPARRALSYPAALAHSGGAIVTAEPEGWDNMRRNLATSAIPPVGAAPPVTAPEASQTQVVAHRAFDVLSRRGATGVAVSEAETARAQRPRAEVEPGGVAALTQRVPLATGAPVLIAGGNVDRAGYAAVLAA